jgi:deferrochelatase/peroxidase EfeB
VTPADRRRLSRRRFLQIGAAAGGGAVLASAGIHEAPGHAATTGVDFARLEGAHQSAVLSDPSAATTFVSFDVVAGSRAELRDLLRTVTSRLQLLQLGGLPDNMGPAAPTGDNGILGPELPAREVAFVLGLGASLFDDRYGLASCKPARLVEMTSFPNDNLDPAQCGGDLSLQVLADDTDVVLHAVRDVTKHTRGAMQPRWRVDGFKSKPRPSGTPRNLLGFKDGISNPDVTNAAEMNRLLWSAEPGWAAGGTYQVARVIRMLVEFWDRVSLNEQENMIGRRRATGAPLDGADETSTPNFAADPHGQRIPIDAHIRLANPRTATSEDSRILRRGYNFDRGLDVNGNLDQGLLFTCYQQDIERQFAATQTRLIDEPLVDYISPTGGGYFFCPRGLGGPGDWFASGLL